jgi:hypothetical protein
MGPKRLWHWKYEGWKLVELCKWWGREGLKAVETMRGAEKIALEESSGAVHLTQDRGTWRTLARCGRRHWSRESVTGWGRKLWCGREKARKCAEIIILIFVNRNWEQIEARQCLLLFGSESFDFQIAIQKFKDQDI